MVFFKQSQDVEDIEDNVFVDTPPTNPHPPRSVATRQEVLKERLRRKQRMNRSAKVVAAAVALQSNLERESSGTNTVVQPQSESSKGGWGDGRRQSLFNGNDVTSIGASKKWGPSSQVISLVGQLASEVEQEESADQFDDDISRMGRTRSDQLSNGPKFKRGYNRGNWRSEVQNITIINKEEIHELRRQLAAKPSIIKRKKSGNRFSISSSDSVDNSLSNQRQSSLEGQNRVLKDFPQEITLNQLESQDMVQDSSQLPTSSLPKTNKPPKPFRSNSEPVPSYLSQQPTPSTPSELELTKEPGDGTERSLDIVGAISSNSFNKDSRTHHSRNFFGTPLISVEEVGESGECPVTDRRPDSHKLKVPRTKKIRFESNPFHKSGREAVKKEMPEWLTKLSAEYNMKVFKNSSLN